jgi:serine phosphatase RsbU (regulator of sigma subunit)
MADARLHVTDRNGRRVVAIETSPFTIGRGAESDLRLAGGEVSRDHAEIVREGDRFVLRDRGSRYGTFVGDEMVTERPLVEGDRIRLGRSSAIELVFLQEAEAGEPTRASLVEAVRQTAALLEGLRALGAGHLLTDVLALVLDAAIAVSGADRGFILLANKAGLLESTLGRGRGRLALSGDAVISIRIPEEVFATGEPRMLTDVVDTAAATHDATLALGIRQVLCVPLRVTRFMEHGAEEPEPTRIGVLYLDSREPGSGLLSDTIRFGVETLATEAAIAIENARLYREAVERTRVDQELRVAADVQAALRPPAHYETSSFELAAASRASRLIGGDFFHYLQLPDGSFAFALGDVAGKGPPAAVLAAAVEGMFAAYSESGREPADTLSRINTMLSAHFDPNRFATMVLGVLQENGRLTYSNAGHNPPMLFDGPSVRRLDTGGLPLGLFPDARYSQETLQLAPGNLLVLFSDGVTETTATDGEYFGDEGIFASIADAPDRRPEPLLQRLLSTLEAFRGEGLPEDDVTCVMLLYRASNEVV